MFPAHFSQTFSDSLFSIKRAGRRNPFFSDAFPAALRFIWRSRTFDRFAIESLTADARIFSEILSQNTLGRMRDELFGIESYTGEILTNSKVVCLEHS